MKGLVFNIQRYSIHDGPGIRTVVFLKGCPLRCVWCCNPEALHFFPEVEFRESVCQHCGNCVSACPHGAFFPDPWSTTEAKIDRQLCDNCGQCVRACPSGALRMVGEWRGVQDVMADIIRDASYYRRSGGGVTLSGGEPMSQPDFSLELLKACYQRAIHTAIETTGCVQWSLYERALPFTDLFLYDLKQMDTHLHRQATGAPNATVLENARRLAKAGAKIIVRLPLIPGHNTEEDHLSAAADFARSIHALEVHLMPFHQLGKDKYRRLGYAYAMDGVAGLRESAQGQAVIRRARESLMERGLTVFVGG